MNKQRRHGQQHDRRRQHVEIRVPHELELLARHTYLDVLSTTIVLLAVAPQSMNKQRRHFLEADRESRRGGLVADLAQLPLLIFGRVGSLVLRRPARSA